MVWEGVPIFLSRDEGRKKTRLNQAGILDEAATNRADEQNKSDSTVSCRAPSGAIHSPARTTRAQPSGNAKQAQGKRRLNNDVNVELDVPTLYGKEGRQGFHSTRDKATQRKCF